MVLDSFANLGYYAPLNPHFKKVVDYLKKTDLKALPEGRYDIDGDNAFVLISERDLKKPADAALEAHDAYIDIQVVITGREGFGWKDRALCTAPRGAMDTTKDIIFYDDTPSTYFELGEGEIGIFFPADGHAPLVGEGHVKKGVVKVKF